MKAINLIRKTFHLKNELHSICFFSVTNLVQLKKESSYLLCSEFNKIFPFYHIFLNRIFIFIRTQTKTKILNIQHRS